MADVNSWAVLVAAIGAVVAAMAYYTVFGSRLAALGSASADAPTPAWLLPVELLRALVVSLVVAILATRIEVTDAPRAALLALGLWAAFPLVLLAGSVIHERVPAKLAAIHGGDWLIKLVLISIVVSLWR